MSSDESKSAPSRMPAAPLTLEGFAVLHQMFRIRRDLLRALEAGARKSLIDEATAALDAMASREDSETAAFAELGHKGDLILVHFRRTFDELRAAQTQIARTRLHDFLETTTSYLSIIEIGMYEASVALYRRLAAQGLTERSEEWSSAVATEVGHQRNKLTPRLFPRIPERRYLCFYPMDKKREGSDNWYRLPIESRQRLMHEHGMVGRRFAGEVTQIISGSIGFDDYEWGVDLFADDPLVFKRLVYEMRFDEASAGYARFGPFYIGIRLDRSGLAELLAA